MSRLPVALSWTEDAFRLDVDTDAEHLSAWAAAVWRLNQQEVGAAWAEQVVRDVLSAVLVHRREALLEGAHRLTPLTQKDLARLEDLDASAISRVVGHVALHTADGVILPDRLFTEAVRVTGLSSVQIELLIFTALRDAGETLSDQGVSDALGALGVTVARRTAAKVRDELRVPAAGARRGWTLADWSDAEQALVASLSATPSSTQGLAAWLASDSTSAERVAAMRRAPVLARPHPATAAAEAAGRLMLEERVGEGAWGALSSSQRERLTDRVLAAVGEAIEDLVGGQ